MLARATAIDAGVPSAIGSSSTAMPSGWTTRKATRKAHITTSTAAQYRQETLTIRRKKGRVTAAAIWF
jgi:hypothetical protein